MGACNAEGKARDKPRDPVDGEKIEKRNEIIDIEQPITNTNTNEDNNKLKGPKINQMITEYNISFTNLSSNESDIPIEKKIQGNITLNQFLIDLKLRENADFEIEFENDKKIGNNKKDEKFDDLMKEIFNNTKPEKINMKYTYKGLSLPENIIQAYQDANTIIGYCIMENAESFGIITYEIENKVINSYNYKKEFKPELNNFGSFTAYCNAKNCLFLSGGEEEQKYDLDPDKSCLKYTDFYCIDLTQLEKENLKIKELPNLKESRTWHSMIFVPDKYIFIVGGSNTKSVELYDMNNNQISKDSELNEVRSECTLCLINNRYLYAFFGFLINQEYNKTIERCDLFKEQRKWEYVNYKEKERFEIIESFFGISYFNDNELLLIGGNDNGNEKRYDYKYIINNNNEEEDTIEEYDCDIKGNTIVFREKLFLPVKDNKAINIPLVIGDDVKIFEFENNENNGKIKILNYLN